MKSPFCREQWLEVRSTRDVANISVLASLSALGLEVRSTREDTTENIKSVSSQPYLNALFRFEQKTCRKRQVVFLWRVGRLACKHIATKKTLGVVSKRFLRI